MREILSLFGESNANDAHDRYVYIIIILYIYRERNVYMIYTFIQQLAHPFARTYIYIVYMNTAHSYFIFNGKKL